MPTALEETFLEKHRSDGLVIGVGIDGSVMCDKAVDMACTICSVNRKDKVFLLHVSAQVKRGELPLATPRHLLADHLKNRYLSQTAHHHVTSEWAARAKEDGESTCEALTKLAALQHVDMLVVGSFGRKGDKLDMLGSVADYSLRESHCSICIVRSTAQAIQGPATHMLATDGSRAAALAFCVLIHQLRRPEDVILVTHVVDGADNNPDILAPYQELMTKHKVKGECYIHRKGRDDTVATGLLQAAAARQVDSIVLGTADYRNKRLGSVSQDVAVRGTCNTIIIKDVFEVLNNAFATAGARTLTDMTVPERIRKERTTGGDR